MNTENLLSAVRPLHFLITRPGQSASTESKRWSLQLEGLHKSHIKASAKALRNSRKRTGAAISDDASLKVSGLHHGIANALGAKSFDAWLDAEDHLVEFLLTHGMTQPTNLISWSRAPSRLTARQLSDRLFNSVLPIPKRIFTGVGSSFFNARGCGRYDIILLSDFSANGDIENYEWCEARVNQIVLPNQIVFPEKNQANGDSGTPETIDLTGRDLLLHAFKDDHIAVAFNLLGDNLVDPMDRPPEFRLYNTSEDELAFIRQVFDIFREEIERSHAGWVEVIPLPGNENIIFLKGENGAFDWVIRDQRDQAFTGNSYHPILKNDELPVEMKASTLDAHLYFTTGEWYERLEHNAEARHYAEGGVGETLPSYPKLLLRELIATRSNFSRPNFQKGRVSGRQAFVPHRLDGYCLMVSPLVTIQDFWQFYKNSDWQETRVTRSISTSSPIEADLAAVNLHDEDHLPVSLTWFDAVAFCRYFEDKTGLPVRLLEIEEWKKISPPLAQDNVKVCRMDTWSKKTFGVIGEDGENVNSSKLRYRETISGGGFPRFGKELTWTQNHEGLHFLFAINFGEWLAGYIYGHAPAANAVTGESLGIGPLERALCPARSTMSRKGMKVGFRLCYVAKTDA